jgi:hypothetical protein
MCSTPDSRLDRLGSAIEELAAEAAEVAAGAAEEPGALAGRLVELWAMVADLDPALAQRLRGYTAPG